MRILWTEVEKGFMEAQCAMSKPILSDGEVLSNVAIRSDRERGTG